MSKFNDGVTFVTRCIPIRWVSINPIGFIHAQANKLDAKDSVEYNRSYGDLSDPDATPQGNLAGFAAARGRSSAVYSCHDTWSYYCDGFCSC